MVAHFGLRLNQGKDIDGIVKKCNRQVKLLNNTKFEEISGFIGSFLRDSLWYLLCIFLCVKKNASIKMQFKCIAY
jgi:hypothetical protein